jgi:hypothetical protein
VIEHGDTLWLDVGLDPAEVELLAASDEEPLVVDQGDSGWWSKAVVIPDPEPVADDETEPADLPASHAVGDVWRGFATAEDPVECKVKGFHVVVRGTPHHQKTGEAEAPTCGTPRVFAELGCPETIAWAVPEAAPLPTRYTEVSDREPSPSSMAAAMITLTGSDLYVTLRSAAQDASELQKKILVESTDIRMFRTGDGQEVLVVHGTLKSGESDPECGSSGVHTEIVGIVDARGDVLTPFRELSGEVQGLVDLDQDGRPELIQHQWPAMPTLVGGDGEPLCRLPTSYCDSPCVDDLGRDQ